MESILRFYMSIDQENIIDYIGENPEMDEIVLFIIDGMDWSSNESEHILALQNKINSYLSFIENGELIERYPEADKRKKFIEIRAKYPLSKSAETFYELASNKVKEAHASLRYVVDG